MYLKYSLVFMFVTLYVVATADKIIIQVTPEQMLQLTEVSNKCAETTGLDPKILSKLIGWKFDQDDSTKPYIHCLGVKGAFLNSEGGLNIPKLLEFKTVNATQEEYLKVLESCKSLKGENQIETTVAMANCVHESVMTKIL